MRRLKCIRNYRAQVAYQLTNRTNQSKMDVERCCRYPAKRKNDEEWQTFKHEDCYTAKKYQLNSDRTHSPKSEHLGRDSKQDLPRFSRNDCQVCCARSNDWRTHRTATSLTTVWSEVKWYICKSNSTVNFRIATHLTANNANQSREKHQWKSHPPGAKEDNLQPEL